MSSTAGIDILTSGSLDVTTLIAFSFFSVIECVIAGISGYESAVGEVVGKAMGCTVGEIVCVEVEEAIGRAIGEPGRDLMMEGSEGCGSKVVSSLLATSAYKPVTC